MSEFRIASRYAKSLIGLAIDSKKLEEINNDMLCVSKACSDSRDLSLLIKNPIIKGDKKRSILHAIFTGKVSDLTLSFFDLIIRKRREKYLPLIASEVHEQYNAVKGIQKSTVSTAFPLTQELRKEFERLTQEITGMTPDLTELVDEDLIGGYVLKIGDRQIDDSIKTKLNELQLALVDKTYE